MSGQLHAQATFTPGGVPCIHSIGGWVDPRAGLDDVEKILDSTRDSNSDLTVVQPVAKRNTDYAIPASLCLLLARKKSVRKFFAEYVL
jgi:hypothetical protein